jgi:ABC-type phosphate transport system substrate-binding protein
VASVAAVLVVLPAGIGSASVVTGSPSATVAAAVAAPDNLLQNQQVVTVEWSGFTPTSLKLGDQGAHDDDVAIVQCVANPPGGIYYFYDDCYSAGENLGGNIVAPYGGPSQQEIPEAGTTDATGDGNFPFEVQEGTLETELPEFSCSTSKPPDCNQPYSVQCDINDACVLKVVALPGGAPGYMNEIWQGPPTTAENNACAKHPAEDCDMTQLLDSAPSVPLDFGPIPNCPSVTTGNLDMEGSDSASYAVQEWASTLCHGSNPLTINYAEVGDTQAKTDLLDGTNDVALASVAPTAQDIADNPGAPSIAAAPIDAGGVSIVFNMVDPITGLPIGCSANIPASQCSSTVRLTPRLMAMLLTNSATLSETEPAGHQAAYALPGSPNFEQPLTADPEFEALNPGFHTPGFCTGSGAKEKCSHFVEEPALRLEQNDDAWILTQWIADDYDAQQFLAGRDPCGAKLNVDWEQAQYPDDQFQELASSSEGTTPDSDSYYPMLGTEAVEQALLYGIPPGGPPASSNGANKTWTPVPTDNYAFFGVMDTVSGNRSGLPAADLISADPTGSELAKYVTEGAKGKCAPDTNVSYTGFVADNSAGLDEAYKDMSAAPGPYGTLVSPVTSTDPNAYPLAKIDYAFVPTSGLSLTNANLISQFIDFAAGPGQTPTYLPPGYTPLPSNLSALAEAVAKEVVTDATPKPTPPTTVATTPTTTPSTVATTTPTDTDRPGTTTSATTTPAASIPANSGTPGIDDNTTPTTYFAATPAKLREASVDVGAGALGGGWLVPLLGALAVLFAGAGLYLRRRVRKVAGA